MISIRLLSRHYGLELIEGPKLAVTLIRFYTPSTLHTCLHNYVDALVTHCHKQLYVKGNGTDGRTLASSFRVSKVTGLSLILLLAIQNQRIRIMV